MLRIFVGAELCIRYMLSVSYKSIALFEIMSLKSLKSSFVIHAWEGLSWHGSCFGKLFELNHAQASTQRCLGNSSLSNSIPNLWLELL